MAVEFLVAFAAFLLEYKDFVILEVFEDFSLHASALNHRCAHLNLTVVVCQQYPVEAHGGAFGTLQTVYIELPSLLSLKLLSCYFYDYIHSVDTQLGCKCKTNFGMCKIFSIFGDMEDGKYLTGAQRELLIPRAYEAALRGGAAIMEHYGRRDKALDVDLKRDLSPITEADRAAHRAIREWLGPMRVPVLSEEGREMRFDERRDWEMFWLVDPLDGTREYIKGTGEFTVNIALMVDHRPVVGIIFVPVLQKIYVCEKGHGSFVRSGVAPDAAAGGLSWRDVFEGASRLPLSTEVGSPLRIAVSRSHPSPETTAYVAEIQARFPGAVVIEQGSSYKFGLLAEGAVDCYVRASPTYEWDTAAGEVILSETGGTTSSLPELEKFAYNKESLLNPWFVCRSGSFQES